VKDLSNSKLLPLERNRYYPGKLLTSADFLAEQDYFANKRRFFNEFVIGSGIVCGLGVINLDDTTILVESGTAIDESGREIILDQSIVQKLPAIPGHDALQTNEATLCIRYAEESVQPVYAVGSKESEDGYEMNRIREGCSLYLIDSKDVAAPAGAEAEFLSEAKVYEDENYLLTIQAPARAPRSSGVRFRTIITKKSDVSSTFELEALFAAPAFSGANDAHEFQVRFSETDLRAGERRYSDAWLTARADEAPDTMILAKPGDIKIRIDGEEKAFVENVMLKLAVVADDAAAVVERELARSSLEARTASPPQEGIPLAEITVVRSGSSAIIAAVKEDGVRRYVRTIANDGQRREYADWFEGGGGAPLPAPKSGASARTEPGSMSPREPVYMTGVLEIPLGVEDKKNKVFYSSEIVHGLGPGDVHVDVGIEYLADDAKLGKQAKNTIYGNPMLFYGIDGAEVPVPQAELGVRVMAERGSFIVAARLLKNTNYVVILLRWTATKLPFREEKNISAQLADNARISPVHPTIVIAPNESAFIDVRFKNMEPCALEYELTESNSGTITPDGIYTASNKEGVHEIYIYSAENQWISTYAYVVVKKDVQEG
jgi:hypothetical protein